MKIYINENILKDSKLKPQEVYLLLHLINLANNNGEISISHKELLSETRFTNSAMLIRYINNLISNNYVNKVLGGGAGIKNKYILNIESIEAQ